MIGQLLENAPQTAGCPMGKRKWTHQTADRIAEVLYEEFAIKVSGTVVRRLLKEQNYSLKSNRKNLSSGNAPNRDEQFRRIADLREEFARDNKPIISIDTKKKELIGQFKNPGRKWEKEPTLVKDHDFRSEALGIAVPYGVYDVTRNHGMLIVGESADTPEFAVNCVVRWWCEEGCRMYPNARELLILADSGGSNSARSRVWKRNLQEQLANRFGLLVTVAHYPTGASKWNPVEHRMFSEITKNWAAEPLNSFETLLNFAAGATTKTGLQIRACRDRQTYEKGQKVSDKEMKALNLRQGDSLPQWNYSIVPKPDPSAVIPHPSTAVSPTARKPGKAIRM